ncbi:MAG: BspA family leucine-rich repeat surface protein [Bacteroidetes bacterium]|nr:BspA family leucine-rich repeat surface protein [Bacteroidota bacterium]
MSSRIRILTSLIDGWNVSNVIQFDSMFQNNVSFNTSLQIREPFKRHKYEQHVFDDSIQSEYWFMEYGQCN